MGDFSYTRAVILGASGGIGRAIVELVPAQEVLPYSRQGGDFDLGDENSIEDLAQRCIGADFVFDATGALEIDGNGPEKSLLALNADHMAAQFAINAIGPALLLKYLMPVMARSDRTVFASLSARVGSIGDNRLGGWVSYRAAKAALNQIVHTASIEMTRHNKQSICVAMHPGTVATELTRKYVGRHPTVAPIVAAQNLLGVIDGLTPADTGGFFDWKGGAVPW